MRVRRRPCNERPPAASAERAFSVAANTEHDMRTLTFRSKRLRVKGGRSSWPASGLRDFAESDTAFAVSHTRSLAF